MPDQTPELAPLPAICDQREKCCGTPACLNAGIWTHDPYDEPIYVRQRSTDLGHLHAEPVCAFPDCETHLTRSQVATMRARQRRYLPASPTTTPTTEETR